MSLTIDLARRILEASKQRAHELRSPVSIAIVDAGGHLVLAERMMAPYGWATIQISIAQIPGFASSMAGMSEGKFIMAAGGWPIRLNGATIGGIGVSGGNASGRDDEIARSGLAIVEGPRYAPQPGYVQVRPIPQQAYTPNPQSPSPERAPLSSVNLDLAEELNSRENPYGDGPASTEPYNESSGN